MILDVFRCDRCGEESDVCEPGDYTEFVEVIAPCHEHGSHRLHYCGWECAMHACARHLDHEESIHGEPEEEEAHDEAD